ncbi:MAG TPA: hypothetical protein VEX64_10275, partial [Pyrinomonadaceae bacterium]|nr:hypothetical protein [Pyrinomonadaceae bacterium]
TFSKSIDTSSSDPGSTAGGGKPDVPNTGFIVQGDSRNPNNNKALSDFDRTHRFSTSFLYEIPSFGSQNRFLNGWQVSGFFQAQSGTPFSIFAAEPELATTAQLALPANATEEQRIQYLARGSGGLYRLGFGRPNISCSAEQAYRGVSQSSVNQRAFDLSCFSSPLGGFGNLGRNAFRGPSQSRFDIGLAKNTRISERVSFEVGLDIFNLFNSVNFANPNSDLQDTADFGKVTNTVGGPRVGQLRAKLRF